MRLVRIGNSLRLTIPVEVCEALGLKERDLCGVSIEDSRIVVRKLK